MTGKCQQCGLPIAECNAVALARRAAEVHLREEEGYSAIDAKAASRRLIPDHKTAEPDYGQPWRAEQLVKGGNWAILNCVDRIVARGIDTHGQAALIVSKINGS